MGLFGSLSGKSAGELFGAAREKLKDAGAQIEKTVSKVSSDIREQSAEQKAAKAPLAGALGKYEVVYSGGLARYKETRNNEIGLNIMKDRFVFKATLSSGSWFEDMEIRYTAIQKVQIIRRKITNRQWILSSSDSDMKGLEQESVIEITFYDENQKTQVVRFEMVSGISIYGAAQKCVEFMDVLRQNEITDQFIGEGRPGEVQLAQQAQTLQEQDVEPEAIIGQIEKLAKLKDSGILTEEEFAKKKTELLAKL